MPRRANSRELICLSTSVLVMVHLSAGKPFPAAPPVLRPKPGSKLMSCREDTTPLPPRLIRGEIELSRRFLGGALDLHRAQAAFRPRPHEIAAEEPVVEGGALHLHALGEAEGARELPPRHAAREQNALGLLLLAPTRRERG